MSKLIILCGLPGSGKSTYAKFMENAIVISTDEIRKKINGDASNQDNANLVFDIAFNKIRYYLINKEYENVVFDATNINYKRRIDIVNRFRKYADSIECHFIWATYEECLERNSKRDRVVPEEVIKRMYFNFYVPQDFEGYDKIKLIENSYIYETMDKLKEKMKIDQENPNHKLNLLEHSLEAARYICKNYFNDKFPGIIATAAMLHDIGKIKTKTFINAKGETTNIAHYYSHEKVGAYDSFLYTKGEHDFIRFYIAKLIQWHMLLHQNLSDKSINKYREKLGRGFWEYLNILHEADLAGH